ncbi:6-hydroxynicotinate 3-monooxygenase-like protein, partial [Trifolium pratense]
MTLARDESLNFRAAHWADLHGVLYDALPKQAKVLQTGEIIEIVGDLLVAADGCLSSIRQKYLPEFKLRYSGYCAWRGVLDFSEIENSETIIGTHSVLYELLNKKLNWLWYVNQPEPEVKGTSVTTKVTGDMIQKMHQEAEKIWIPELAK